jgi:hypothetical protein
MGLLQKQEVIYQSMGLLQKQEVIYQHMGLLQNRELEQEMTELTGTCLSCLPRTKLAREAVTRLLAHSRKAWSSSNSLVLMKPITIATTEPSSPTTIAWH